MNFGFIGQGVGETSDSAAEFSNPDPESDGGVGRISTVVSDTLASGEFSRVRIFSAFASEAGVKQLDSQLSSGDDVDVTVTVGIDHGNTSTEALEALRQSTAEAGVFVHEKTTYHPKVYYFESEETFRVVVGSGNLTSRGLNTNVEAAFVFEGSVGSELHGDLQDFFETIESEATEITTALISDVTDTERVESERDTSDDDAQTATDERELDDQITADTPVGTTYTRIEKNPVVRPIRSVDCVRRATRSCRRGQRCRVSRRVQSRRRQIRTTTVSSRTISRTNRH